ncbi:hypothetical protein SAMN05216503_0655 [Polaribacter sp. KT25b]|uniref:hypothetical protein n=1 Tax=Polaribacter sp. KT25b TaxID=1855336 RepID=UPI00087C3355|nr:hypothetical protein [Polaribacter sp. KT25b]SDR73162.1 hypothetical protein SAMN05216503_0655 [Polaribacter sp. KT25b]
MKPPIKISVLFCIFLLTSCYESLDFNQLDDQVSKPVFTSAITYFTFVPAQFFDSNGNQKLFISDITNFYGFQNSYIKENLVKIDFNAEIKNEFDREVTLQVEFLNRNNAVVYSFTPIIVKKENLNYIYYKEIEIVSNPTILETEKVRITARLENTGSSLNANDTREFEFKSSVTIYIESSI